VSSVESPASNSLTLANENPSSVAVPS